MAMIIMKLQKNKKSQMRIEGIHLKLHIECGGIGKTLCERKPELVACKTLNHQFKISLITNI